MSDQKRPVVWVVDNSLNKTIKDVIRFGEPEHIYSYVDKDIDLVNHARDVLSAYREGDYLCLIGDPKLSCIAAAVIVQMNPSHEIKFLQWDARSYRYEEFNLSI